MIDLLDALKKSALGFTSFRPHQEDVCRAVISGQDALLVMPTGAGKSLCYQLPSQVLKGTTLIISPLIALMEDQVAKMQARGLKAERIHAGRDRSDSRQACFDYLEGKLEYLYIAPERLGVPNFPEMLARRKPILVAIDEAHCISHWGHDFRPDYRRLKERLALIRPCPILAVTATATKMVQEDIVKQLDLSKVRKFIHGFRRENIGIEVLELNVSAREEKVGELLEKPDRRPCIIYSPTRKASESLAESLKQKFSAEAYHAGLPTTERDRIQKAFSVGEIEVVVATIAFGMGIDKANVRTVIHTAMPASIEAYYQELGRAGRDGNLSRAILMCSYADRRTHEFFLERDYPEESVLSKVYSAVGEQWQPKDTLMAKVSLDDDVFERALEKLWVHEGVEVDFSENIRLGKPGWEQAYRAQRLHKINQMDQVTGYFRSRSCRMAYLVEHFGDTSDRACGLCDFCAPDQCLSKIYRAPTEAEKALVKNLLGAIKERNSLTVGQLHQAFANSLDRNDLEDLLESLSRAGIVRLVSDTFEKDGKLIAFKRIMLTHKGQGSLDELRLSTHTVQPSAKKRSNAKRKKVEAKTALEGVALDIFHRLRDWRLQEARKKNVPAFCILTDRVLRAIAIERPQTEGELMQISGMGPKLFEKHGEAILETLAEA